MSDYGNYRERKGGKVFFGLLIILAGVAIFLRQIDMLPYFSLHFAWPIILIAVGLFIGVRNSFRSVAPFVLIAIGVFNLIPGFSFEVGGRNVDSEELVAPALLVFAGLILILKPRKKKAWTGPDTAVMVNENTINADIVFGGRKEIITSKDFRGGRITATFGGCEINLLQADSSLQQIILDIRATFGGCEIIVPSGWEVKNEIEPVFGSVEDQRTLRTPEHSEAQKTLVLRGSCIFGGVEIKSF